MNLNLPEYLFWDINKAKLDAEKHVRFIIERVITHGDLKDWHTIKKEYGLEKIKNEVLKIRSLDKKTLNLFSLILDIPIQEFRCYKQTQSINTHWNY